MRIRNTCFLIPLVALTISSVFQMESADAQRPWASRTNWNRGHRYFGAWYSDGYHVRTPGPNVSHYQPWTPHNSSRFSPWQKGEGNSGYHPTTRYFDNSNQVPSQVYPQPIRVNPGFDSAPVLEDIGIAPDSPLIVPPKPPLPKLPIRRQPKEQPIPDTGHGLENDSNSTFRLKPPGNHSSGQSHRAGSHSFQASRNPMSILRKTK